MGAPSKSVGRRGRRACPVRATVRARVAGQGAGERGPRSPGRSLGSWWGWRRLGGQAWDLGPPPLPIRPAPSLAPQYPEDGRATSPPVPVQGPVRGQTGQAGRPAQHRWGRADHSPAGDVGSEPGSRGKGSHPFPLPRLSPASSTPRLCPGLDCLVLGRPRLGWGPGLWPQPGNRASWPIGFPSHSPRTVAMAVSMVTMTVHHMTPPYGCSHPEVTQCHPTIIPQPLSPSPCPCVPVPMSLSLCPCVPHFPMSPRAHPRVPMSLCPHPCDSMSPTAPCPHPCVPTPMPPSLCPHAPFSVSLCAQVPMFPCPCSWVPIPAPRDSCPVLRELHLKAPNGLFRVGARTRHKDSQPLPLDGSPSPGCSHLHLFLYQLRGLIPTPPPQTHYVPPSQPSRQLLHAWGGTEKAQRGAF